MPDFDEVLPFLSDLGDSITNDDLYQIYLLGRMHGRLEMGFVPREFEDTLKLDRGEIEHMLREK